MSIILQLFPVVSNVGWLRFVGDELFWVCFTYNENTEYLKMWDFVNSRVKGTPYLSVSQRAAMHDKIYAKVAKLAKHLSPPYTDKADNNYINTQSGKLTSLLSFQHSDSSTRNPVVGCLIWLEKKDYLREGNGKLPSAMVKRAIFPLYQWIVERWLVIC